MCSRRAVAVASLVGIFAPSAQAFSASTWIHAGARNPAMHSMRAGENMPRAASRSAVVCQAQREPALPLQKDKANPFAPNRAGSVLDKVALGNPLDVASDPANVARATMMGVAAMYGTNFGSIKILEEAMPSSVAAAVRFTMATIVLLPLVRGLKREIVMPSLEIGLLCFLGYFAQGISLASGGSDASTAAFLCSLAVVVCPLLDLVQGTRSLGKVEAASVALAVTGTAVLELSGTAPSAGDLWAMVQPLAFGTAFWKVEQLMRQHPSQASPITFLQVLGVSLFSIAWALADLTSGGAGVEGISHAATALSDALHSDSRLPAALLWTSCFTTALTVWLETKALGALSSAETTLLFSTEPLWAAAFAHVALAEQLGPNVWVGGALILTACVSRCVLGEEDDTEEVEEEEGKWCQGGSEQGPDAKRPGSLDKWLLMPKTSALLVLAELSAEAVESVATDVIS